MLAKLAILSSLTTCVALAHPAFADTVSDGVAAMPGGVEDVRIGGSWQRGGDSGVYRIVVARAGGDSVTARFFVQWVAYREAGGTSVEDSLEINEFADLKLDVVDYVSESDAEGLSVYIETIDPDDGASEQYELFIFGPDEYRFGPATN